MTQGLGIYLFALSISACDNDSSNGFMLRERPPALDLSLNAACNDGIDNDGDGLIDMAEDPGCESPQDIDERDPLVETICTDQLDNDNDGLVDYNDPGCVESEGREEENGGFVPQCSNGEDDDGDGYIDFPADESCLSPEGIDESLEVELTACNNQRDDDADGLIDFPFDPGCASAQDLSEQDDIDASMIAQCNDGLDNDLDGYTDLADPQCSTSNDPRERMLDDEVIAVCSNGLDDDEDGLIDAQEDPGCVGPGGATEQDLGDLPACSDGLDNDFNGYIDFPNDPGCSSIGDPEESPPRVQPECLDGVDNDEDDQVDFPFDPGCDSASDTTERGACQGSAEVIELRSGQVYRGTSRQGRFSRTGSCGGRGAPELTALYQVRERLRRVKFVTRAIEGEERDGWETTLYARHRCDETAQEIACSRETIDGLASNELIIEDPPQGPIYLLVDGASGRGGSIELFVEETLIEACQNGEDDDGDGLIDFPVDPGCLSTRDTDETSPAIAPSCANQLDDDDDGLIDFPQDIGCRAAFDDDEIDECGQGAPVYNLAPPPSSFIGDSRRDGVSSEHAGSCGGVGIEQMIRYDNPGHAKLTFELYRTDGVAEMAYLHARFERCLEISEELGCASGLVGEVLTLDQEDQDESEAPSEEALRYGSPLTLELESAPQGPIYIFIDHGLEGFPFLMKTTRIPLSPLCTDGVDNDGDELIDEQDPGCRSADDEDERDPPQLAVCNDGLDNDIDGQTDYPLDPGCAYHGGESEEDPDTAPSCSNGIDDNGDGYTDFPYDIGCASRGDDTEANLPALPRCVNGRDDDEDGLVDFPYDPGCIARGDDSEVDEERTPHCSDGLDNDQNGMIDYPFDPGCYAMGDPREQAPATPPQCSDGIDNDQDGFIDLPYDPGCESSGDEQETDPLLPPQCANGEDDDGNGRIDWPDDPGCLTRADNDENSAGPVRARCDDEVDNDDDGDIDLEDIHCQSREDLTEEETPAEEALNLDRAECSDGVDNDGDGFTDWPADPKCAARGDFCESGGYSLCTSVDATDPSISISECVDLMNSVEHCGTCNHACPEGSSCQEGRCEGQVRPLRTRLMNCGSTLRSLEDFLVGPLADQEFIISARCDPDESVQALLVTRSGINGLSINLPQIKRYLQGGGVVITERENGPSVYSKIFDLPTFSSIRLGNCRRNIQPLYNHRPQDPLWSLVPFTPPSSEDSGCGDDLNQLPGLIRVGGWDRETTSLGYRDYGRGRVWLLAADWRDLGDSMTQESQELMAALISGGGAPLTNSITPECMDRIDNDLDGEVDLYDLDCQFAEDESEQPSQVLLLPECSDGIDNDMDGSIDFPLDQSCLSAGTLVEGPSGQEGEESDPPQCSDGIDNDADGLTDWPWDLACQSRADNQESGNSILWDCQNLQDDDGDGLIDFPADPDCLSSTWKTEHPSDRAQSFPHGITADNGRGANRIPPINFGCQNLADDDRDGLVDYPADPECTHPLDQDEAGDTSERSLLQRSAGFVEGLPECLDGIDNDGDLMIDLDDPSCQGAESEAQESDELTEVPACNDGVDNDEDGLIDWPSDLSCQARGDQSEASCEATADLVINLNEALTLNPQGDPSDVQNWRELSPQICGRDQSELPGRTLYYDHQVDGPIEIELSAVLPEGERSAAVSLGLQRACGPLAQTLFCEELSLIDGSTNPQIISTPHLPRGEYIITLNQSPLDNWESRYEAIDLPQDPRSYEANSDITSICWQDGGADSFDCMGRVRVSWSDQAVLLNVGLGLHSLKLNEQTTLRYSSDKAHPNIWRLRFWTAGEALQTDALTLEFFGNLGLDALTTVSFGQLDLSGYSIPYWWYTDDLRAPIKPPVLHLAIPHHGLSAPQITAALNLDQVNLVISDTQVPVTYYLVSSYLPREELLRAIEADLILDNERGTESLLPTEVTIRINTAEE